MSLDQPSLGSAFKLDKYELTREIAGSGVATTWTAKTPDDDKAYVVLRLHRNVTKKAEAVDAFLRDAATGKLAPHANLVPVAQCGQAEGEVFVACEQFAGESLSTLITQAKTDGLPPGVALRIGREMLEGLAAAHGASPAVAHGELNPFHIVVGKDGVTRIAGFGWAQALSKFGPHGLLKPDRLAYASPERVKALSAATANTPTPPVDVAADVFAAGVILWELLSKQRLFASKMEASVVQKVTGGPIGVLANQPGVKVAAGLSEAIHKALERDPAKRSASVNDMLEAIRALPEEDFAKPEDVTEVVEKLGAKAAATPAPAVAVGPSAAAKAPTPAAPVTPGAPKSPLGARPAPAPAAIAPKPVAVTDAKDAKDKEGTPASVRPKPAAPLPKAIPPRKATLVGGVDALKADLPKPPAVAEKKADKPADAAADKPADKPIPKPPAIGESKRPPPPPPRASAPPPPPPKIGMPKPPTFSAKPDAPTPPPARPPIESVTPDEIDVAPESSPKPAEEAKAEPVVTTVGAGLEKPTIPVPAMLALKEEAAKEREAAKEQEQAPKKENEKSIGIEIDLVSADVPIPEASGETEVPDAKSADAARAEVTKTVHTPTSHPSASPRDNDDSPHSRPSAKASALDKLKPRSTLGRYEILMRVAQGGMASVWAARLQGTRGFQKTVAIKTMLPDVSDDPEFETMFLDEARVAARIRHPNVVEIFDLGEQDDVLYLVMEWVEGDTLSGIQKAAKKLGGIPQNITLRIASQICAGLHAAHELRDDNGTLVDLVHRDISPGNILISTTGFAKVTDFGVAKSAGRLHVTRAEGMVKGKTPYLSPEQLGTLPLDRRSDLFSLGVLLYVMVTGLHPFRGDSEFKTVENIALKDPIPPIELVPSVHPDLDKLILKALEKDRTKRYATAAEMQRGLDHVAAQVGDPVTDEDVAAFVKKCLGDTIAKNAADLRAAIAAADAIAADRISMTSEGPAHGPSENKPEIAPVAISDGRDKPIDVSSDSAAAAAAVAAVVSPAGVANDSAAAAPAFAAANDGDAPKKKKNGAVIGIIAAAAVAAGVLAVVFAGGGEKPVDKPAPATTEQAPPKQTAAATQEAPPPAASTEAPKVEEPKVEEPKVEEPKVEEPVATGAPTTTAPPPPTGTGPVKTWKPATTGTGTKTKPPPTSTGTSKTKKPIYDPNKL